MSFFARLFKKKTPKEIPPFPSWEAIIEMMYDKYLDAFADEVIEVVYSRDKSMRYVILKDEKGLFGYQLEAIYQLDEDDWKYICSSDHALPAMWEPFEDMGGKSLFNNLDELKRELLLEPEYKKYFQ